MPLSTVGAGGGQVANLTRSGDFRRRALDFIRERTIFCEGFGEESVRRLAGTQLQMRRPQTLAVATTALTEGVAPAGKNPQLTAVTVSVNQYGDFVSYSDLATLIGTHDIRDVLDEILPDQVARTMDTLCRDAKLAGTAVIYGSTGNGATPAANRVGVTAAMTFNSDIIRRTLSALETASVPRFPDGYYRMEITMVQKQALLRDADWLAFHQNHAAYSPDLAKGEFTAPYLGFRIFASPRGATVASTITVQQGVAYGPGWVARISHEGMPLAYIRKELGSAGTADPLNQQGSHGWKTMWGGAIVGEDVRGQRLETA